MPNEITGTEETVYRRIFDENAFYQVCENAYKKDVVKYFSPSKDDLEGKSKDPIKPPLDLNAITIELPRLSTNYVKV
jgi:hypothetical protein